MGRTIDPNSKTRLEAQARAIRVAERKEAKAAKLRKIADERQARHDAFKAKAERMFFMYQQGVTLEMIGKQYGITRERARQYISSLGYSAKDGGKCKQAEGKRESRKRKIDANLTARYELDADVVRQLRSDGVIGAYKKQEANSKIRGIVWSLTFAQWFSIWQASGKLHLRGRGRGKYVMSRVRDDGAYELGNVHIQLADENSREAVDKWRGKAKQNRGVFCLYPGRELAWYAKANGVSLGFFKTESEAASARAEYLAKTGQIDATRIGRGRGWTYVAKNKKNPYLMQICGISKGCATEEEAVAAYRAAAEQIAEQRNGNRHIPSANRSPSAIESNASEAA